MTTDGGVIELASPKLKVTTELATATVTWDAVANRRLRLCTGRRRGLYFGRCSHDHRNAYCTCGGRPPSDSKPSAISTTDRFGRADDRLRDRSHTSATRAHLRQGRRDRQRRRLVAGRQGRCRATLAKVRRSHRSPRSAPTCSPSRRRVSAPKSRSASRCTPSDNCPTRRIRAGKASPSSSSTPPEGVWVRKSNGELFGA